MRSNRSRLGARIAVVLAVGLAVAPSAADVRRGAATYKELCAKCHGAQGRGDGREAATLKTKPRDFKDCARMAKFADAELFRVIKDGGEAAKLSADMPSYSDAMEDDEIQDLVLFVRSLCPK